MEKKTSKLVKLASIVDTFETFANDISAVINESDISVADINEMIQKYVDPDIICLMFDLVRGHNDNKQDGKNADSPITKDYDKEYEEMKNASHVYNDIEYGGTVMKSKKSTVKISDETMSVVDEFLNKGWSNKAIARYITKNLNTSISAASVSRRRHTAIKEGKLKVAGKSPSGASTGTAGHIGYAELATTRCEELKNAGYYEKDGDIFDKDGKPLQVIFTRQLVKFTIYKGKQIPTKYLVAAFHGYSMNEKTVIYNLDEDQCNTKVENLLVSTDNGGLSIPHRNSRKPSEIAAICKIFAEEKGDKIKTYFRCKKELGIFTNTAMLWNLNHKKIYSEISDDFFTADEASKWEKEDVNAQIRVKLVNVTPGYREDDLYRICKQ